MTWLGSREESIVDENLTSAGQRNATERIAALIIQLYKRLNVLGMVVNGAMPFPLTQQHVADTLGLSLVHTNKSLAKLRKLGMFSQIERHAAAEQSEGAGKPGAVFRRRGRAAAADLKAIAALMLGAAIALSDSMTRLLPRQRVGAHLHLVDLGRVRVPPSLWNSVRVPDVVHRPRPFQPAFGSSMRPSTFLVKKPSGYGTRMSTNLPSTIASSDSPPLACAIGTLAPRPSVL